MKRNPRTRREVKDQLKAAIEAQEKALRRFRAILVDIPSGLPHPDGSERILQASRELKSANRAVVDLLSKLNKASLDGDGKK